MTKQSTRLERYNNSKSDSQSRTLATIAMSKVMIKLAKQAVKQTEELEKAGLTKQVLSQIAKNLPEQAQATLQRVKDLENIAEKKAWLNFLKHSHQVGLGHNLAKRSAPSKRITLKI